MQCFLFFSAIFWEQKQRKQKPRKPQKPPVNKFLTAEFYQFSTGCQSFFWQDGRRDTFPKNRQEIVIVFLRALWVKNQFTDKNISKNNFLLQCGTK